MPVKKSIMKTIFERQFSRRGEAMPGEDATAEIASTLEDISRQAKQEAAGYRFDEDEFFAPTHVLKTEAKAKAAKAEAAPVNEVKTVRHIHLTPEEYEKIIENSFSALDMASQIIDRNRAITASLKRSMT